MDLSLKSLFEWTKLFVRDPRLAAQLVKEATLPVEVAVLMIVVAGVVSTVVSGAYYVAIGSPDIVFRLSETEGIKFQRSSPIVQGIMAVMTGVGLSVAIHFVGKRMGGLGSLAEIMSITAVLQLAVTVIVVAQTLFGLVLPIVALLLMLLSVFVFLRGMGHAVNVGHGFDNMGKSARVLFLSFLALIVVVLPVATIFGLAPEGEVIPLPLGETL